jgi:hypothetical protein
MLRDCPWIDGEIVADKYGNVGSDTLAHCSKALFSYRTDFTGFPRFGKLLRLLIAYQQHELI